MLRVSLALASAFILTSWSLARADEARTDVLLIGSAAPTTDANLPASFYQLLVDELERELLVQNIVMVSGSNYGQGLPSFGSAMPWNEPTGLSDAIDYVVTYYIGADVSNNGAADQLNLTVQGRISNPVTGIVLERFRTPAVSTDRLTASSAQCDKSCLTAALTPTVKDLSDQLSFVLTQKLHFISEDEAYVDVTDASSILERLREGTQRSTNPKTVSSDRGVFEIDGARSINIELFFDFDSYDLTAQAVAQLEPLADALSSPEIGSAEYLIVGHTDASGSEQYNQILSERRAEAVRTHLLKNFLIMPERLLAIGLGETQLRSPSEPNAGVNRRVEIALLLSGPYIIKRSRCS